MVVLRLPVFLMLQSARIAVMPNHAQSCSTEDGNHSPEASALGTLALVTEAEQAVRKWQERELQKVVFFGVALLSVKTAVIPDWGSKGLGAWLQQRPCSMILTRLMSQSW